MATNVELEYLGRGATAQLVAEVKAFVSNTIDDVAPISYTAQTLTEEQKAQARANIGAATEGDTTTPSESPVYCAEYGISTYAEVKAAVDAGQLCFCMYADRLVPLYDVTSDRIRFIHATPTLTVTYYTISSADAWTTNNWALQGISGRVQTIDSSSTSSTYPSAKAVYDFVNETFLGGAW